MYTRPTINTCKDLLIGFINRVREFPGAMVGVIQRDDVFFALYPSREMVVLLDARSIDDMTPHSNFYPFNPPREIMGTEEFVFAFSQEDVRIGTPKQIGEEVRRRLSEDDIDIETRVILQEYLPSINSQS